MFERGSRGNAYNVCSGVGHRLDYVLEKLVLAADIAVSIEVDESRLRTSDTPRLVGDNQKLQALGWRPQIPLSQTLKDVFQRAAARKHANQ